MMIVTICGPLMNLLLALVFGLTLRVIYQTGNTALILSSTGMELNLLGKFLNMFTLLNLGLMFFNLIPIPPLDGSKMLYGLLPFDTATRYERFMGMYGPMLLVLLIVTRATSYIVWPAVFKTFLLIVGAPY
jgi:Zn-dependent protease